MRTALQIEGNEVVITGNAEFTSALVQATFNYEEKQRKEKAKKKQEVSKNISEGKMKSKKKPQNKFRPWTEQEDNRILIMLRARKLGYAPRLGIKKLAKEFGRTPQSIYTRIYKKLKDKV